MEEPIALQVNCVPATLDVRVTFVAVLLQICLFLGELERLATGKTVTTILKAVLLLHPFAEGVTEYVTVSVVYPELANVCLILSVVPPEKPVMFIELAFAVQINVAPVT